MNTSINIAARLSATATCGVNNPCFVEQGCASVCGLYASLSGGVGPYQYTLASGSIPGGTTFGGPSLGGTFTTVSRYPFTVNISDSLGVAASISPFFDVFPHLVLGAGGGGGPLPNGPANVTMPLAVYGPNSKITAVTTTQYKVSGFLYPNANGALAFTLQGTWNTTTPPPFQATVYDNYPCGPGITCSATNTVTLSMG